LKFKTAGKLTIILEEFYRIYPNLIKENRRMQINMSPVGLASTRISTDYAQKFSPITASNQWIDGLT